MRRREDLWQFRSRDLSVRRDTVVDSHSNRQVAKCENSKHQLIRVINFELSQFDSHLAAGIIECLKNSINARWSFYILLAKMYVSFDNAVCLEIRRKRNLNINSMPNILNVYDEIQFKSSVYVDRRFFKCLFDNIDHSLPFISTKIKLRFDVVLRDLVQNEKIIRTW